MGFFDIFKRKKGKTGEVDTGKVDTGKVAFKETIRKSAQENLTSEQLKEKFIDTLGFDEKLKSIPAIREKLIKALDGMQFKTIDDIENNLLSKVLRDPGDGFTHFIDTINSEIVTKKAIRIDEKDKFFNINICDYKEDTDFASIESGNIRNVKDAEYLTQHMYIYDKDTNIEIVRKIVEYKNGEKVLEDTYYRDLEHINIVKHKSEFFKGNESLSEEIETIDLTRKPHDISTLDGVEADSVEISSYYQNLYNRIHSESGLKMSTFDFAGFYEKILNEKINKSFNRKGCFKYMGISEPYTQ